MGLISWFKEQRKWHHAHIAAWQDSNKIEKDGMSFFQIKCLNALCGVMSQQIASVDRKPMKGADEEYLLVTMTSYKENIYIYLDGAEIGCNNNPYRYEEWDFLTPDDLISAFLSRLQKLMKNNDELHS